jgi:hypothetical protein
LFDDTRHHGLDRPVIADIAFDAQRGTPESSISATVLSAVMSFASAANSRYDLRSRSVTATFAPKPAKRLA